jgi:hypothetical protein
MIYDGYSIDGINARKFDFDDEMEVSAPGRASGTIG